MYAKSRFAITKQVLGPSVPRLALAKSPRPSHLAENGGQQAPSSEDVKRQVTADGLAVLLVASHPAAYRVV